MSEQLNRIEQFLISFAEQTNQRFDNLEQRLERVETKIDRTESAQNDDVVGILKHIDNKITAIRDDIGDIKSGQERQDRILEVLSMKALETDSYINDFKRK